MVSYQNRSEANKSKLVADFSTLLLSNAALAWGMYKQVWPASANFYIVLKNNDMVGKNVFFKILDDFETQHQIATETFHISFLPFHHIKNNHQLDVVS